MFDFVFSFSFLCLDFSELMLLGFISLLLTVGTSYVAKICVPKDLGHKWLPCDKSSDDGHDEDDDEGKNEHRKLLSYGQEMVWRRALAAGTDQYDYCDSKVRKLINPFLFLVRL